MEEQPVLTDFYNQIIGLTNLLESLPSKDQKQALYVLEKLTESAAIEFSKRSLTLECNVHYQSTEEIIPLRNISLQRQKGRPQLSQPLNDLRVWITDGASGMPTKVIPPTPKRKRVQLDEEAIEEIFGDGDDADDDYQSNLLASDDYEPFKGVIKEISKPSDSTRSSSGMRTRGVRLSFPWIKKESDGDSASEVDPVAKKPKRVNNKQKKDIEDEAANKEEIDDIDCLICSKFKEADSETSEAGLAALFLHLNDMDENHFMAECDLCTNMLSDINFDPIEFNKEDFLSRVCPMHNVAETNTEIPSTDQTKKGDVFFYCLCCDESPGFAEVKDLKKHLVKDHIRTEEVLECKVCNYMCPKKYTMQSSKVIRILSHFKNHPEHKSRGTSGRAEATGMRCLLCLNSKRYDVKNEIRQHIRSHFKKDRVTGKHCAKCAVCFKAFQGRGTAPCLKRLVDRLLDHFEKHHKDEFIVSESSFTPGALRHGDSNEIINFDFNCLYCETPEKFKSKQALIKHLPKHITPTDNGELSTKCAVCHLQLITRVTKLGGPRLLAVRSAQHMADMHVNQFLTKPGSQDDNDLEAAKVSAQAKLLSCADCQPSKETFPNLIDLRNHLKQYHMETDSLSYRIKCSKCDRHYTTFMKDGNNLKLTLNRLIDHWSTMHNHGPRTCNIAKSVDNVEIDDEYSDEDCVDGEDTSADHDYSNSSPQMQVNLDRVLCCHNCESEIKEEYYINRNILKDHISIMHMKPSETHWRIGCPFCNWEANEKKGHHTSFWVINRLLDHLALSHQVSPYIHSLPVGLERISQPMDCEVNASGESMIVKTVEEKADNEGNPKDEASPQVNDVEDKRPKVLTSAPPVSWQCIVCNYDVFHDEQSFLNHVNQEHSVSEETPKLVCSTCKKSFVGQKLVDNEPVHAIEFYTNHMVRKHNMLPPPQMPVLNCPVAGCCFQTLLSSQMQVHEKIHIDRKELQKENEVFPNDMAAKQRFLKLQKLGVVHIVCDACGQNVKAASFHAHKKHCAFHADSSLLKNYNCELCNKIFHKVSQLRQHMINEHKEDNAYLCQVEGCDASFAYAHHRSYHRWKAHRLSEVPEEEFVKCDECDERIPEPALNGHMRDHHKPCYECDTCSATFIYHELYLKHMEEHKTGENAFLQCSECDYTTRSRGNLWQHCARIHNINRKSCNLCKFVTHSDRHLEKHMSTVHPHGETDVDICTLCDDKQFSSKGAFENHMFVKHSMNISKRRILQCDQCGFQTLGNTLMKSHLSIHTFGRYKCDVCGKEFYNQRNLRCHKSRSHTKRSFSCPHCSYTTGVQGHLDRHIQRSHNHQRYKCNLCRYTTYTEQRYSNHMLKAHNIGRDEKRESLLLGGILQREIVRNPNLGNEEKLAQVIVPRQEPYQSTSQIAVDNLQKNNIQIIQSSVEDLEAPASQEAVIGEEVNGMTLVTANEETSEEQLINKEDAAQQQIMLSNIDLNQAEITVVDSEEAQTIMANANDQDYYIILEAQQ